MTRADLQTRTTRFHVGCIKLCNCLPKTAAGFETGKQLIRSAGSVGSNYRASGRAKSSKDFIYKIEVVLEECDESHYWLEVIEEASSLSGPEVQLMILEAEELTRIFSASDRTAKANSRNKTTSKAKNQSPHTTAPDNQIDRS